MKKLILIFLFINCVPLLRSQAFEKGKGYISAGWGFGNLNQSIYQDDANDVGDKYNSLGPLFGKLEYAISNKIGLGINFAYMKIEIEEPAYWSTSTGYTEKTEFTTMSYIVRFNYHFLEEERVDLYIGAGVGYRSAVTVTTNNDPDASSRNQTEYFTFPIGAELTFGARVLVIPNALGMYTEVGFAKGVIQVGLVGKI
jgi:outer membrane protein W